MKTILKNAVATAALVSGAWFASTPAQADTFAAWNGPHGAIEFSLNSGGYCDAWGCPDRFWDYPVYTGAVFFHGKWYRGPVYYRQTRVGYKYWVHGGWHADEWYGPRPVFARGGKYRESYGLDFYMGHGFRVRDEWRRDWQRNHRGDHGWNDRDDRGGHDRNDNGPGGSDHHDQNDHGDRGGWNGHDRDDHQGGSANTPNNPGSNSNGNNNQPSGNNNGGGQNGHGTNAGGSSNGQPSGGSNQGSSGQAGTGQTGGQTGNSQTGGHGQTGNGQSGNSGSGQHQGSGQTGHGTNGTNGNDSQSTGDDTHHHRHDDNTPSNP